MNRLILISILIVAVQSSLSFAQWSNDPTVNTEISTMVGQQRAPAITSDGDGGAIIAWHDGRSGVGDDIFAQRVDRFGVVQWTEDGKVISGAPNGQFNPVVVSDGGGGAIIAWVDDRTGSGSDIFAQRVSTTGDTLWTEGGVKVSGAANSQFNVRIAGDGAGGAILTWMDDRNGNDDIFAQRVGPGGLMMWPEDGIPICDTLRSQSAPAIVSDGAGGAIIAWYDSRSGVDNDIFAQRVNASGATLWPDNGAGVITFTGNQEFAALASDGTGGAIIAWEDYRSGPVDIFAQRASAATGAPLWAPNGVPVCLSGGDQLYISMVSDGAGGAIMTWDDRRNGSAPDIFAQRIGSGGSVLWAPNGASVCVTSGHQRVPMAIPDGAGGAIITWYDSRNGTFDIFAQRMAAVGGAPLWNPLNGVAISTAAENQMIPVLTGDGAGGAVITWEDFRNGLNWDVFAQQVASNGTLGNPATAVSGPMSAPPALVLYPNHPNPFARETTIDYELPREMHVRIRVLDLNGRVLAHLADGIQPAGQRRIVFDAHRFPAGTYFYELTSEGQIVSRKLTLAP